MSFWHFLVRLLGLEQKPESLGFAQVALRALIIFAVALALMRLGHKRSLARKSAFDTAFIVIFGAILARAINGSAPFFPTICAAAALVFLHRGLGYLAYRSARLENLLKGRPDLLVSDGETIDHALRRRQITSEDLEEDLRLRGQCQLAEVTSAHLERSGEISFLKRKPPAADKKEHGAAR